MKILAVTLFLFINAAYGQSVKYLTANDAMKILGQQAVLLESKKENRDSAQRTSMLYSTTINGIKSNLNFLIDEYKAIAPAQKRYANLISQNTGLLGQNNLLNIADEAWWHTDSKNFILLMARKNNKILRIKVNKLTKKTSLLEIKNIAKRIASTI